MSEGGTSRPPVVGADRDPAASADTIERGTSLVVAGALGSGKSFFLRAIADELRERGHRPAVLHAGPRAADRRLGVLQDAADERARALLDETRVATEPVIVVVDDAHRMDDDSVDVLIRAVYRGAAVLLAGLELPRVRSTGTTGSGSAAGHLTDLWLSGGAERIDLQNLTPADAARLLSEFPGASELDAVTRAAIVAHADGSRILLRELTSHAASAAADGRDPLPSLSDVGRHTRLGDALHAQVAEVDAAHRVALAVLGHLPGIAYADACRLLPAETMDALIDSSLIHDDRSAPRRLYANALLAREASHQTPPDVVRDAIEDLAQQMHDADGAWWSIPVAVALEKLWHGRRSRRWTPSKTAQSYRRRVRSDAARWALDRGRPDLALAFATSDDPAAALDRAQADATIQGQPAPLRDVDVAALDRESLLRYLTLRLHLSAGIPAASFLEGLDPAVRSDPRVIRAFALSEAETAALDLDWRHAVECGERLFADSEASPLVRLRAGLIAALGRAYDGASEPSRESFRRVHALLASPEAASQLSVEERLLALSVELLAAHTSGDVVADAEARLADETHRATRKRSALGVVLAGLSGALLWARSEEPERALREARAAIRRSAHVRIGPAGTLLQYAIARTLAVLGRVGEAHDLLEHVIDQSAACRPLLRHARLLTQSSLLLAEGKVAPALGLAHQALVLSEGGGAKLLHLRDLYQLVALGAADDEVLDTMAVIAHETGDNRVRRLTEQATAVARGRRDMRQRSAVERLRVAAPWIRSSSAAPAGAASPRDPADAADSAHPSAEPTRREIEIIGLVAEGLSNREIAGRLFLSVRTVESHVYQARMKLGARSRAELTRYAAAEPTDLTARNEPRSVEAR